MARKKFFFWGAVGSVSLVLNLIFVSERLHANGDGAEKYQHVLSDLLYYVSQMYVEPIDQKTLLIGAIRGLMSATGDPYTRFLDREEHAEFNATEGGQRIGIGVEVAREGEYPVVISPVEGSPADRAGILPGDKIIAIDGVSTRNLDFTKLLSKISGEAGTIVRLEIARDGEAKPLDVQIVRGTFNLDYCRGGILGDRTGYIRLTHFFGEDSGSIETFRNFLEQFVSKKVNGIIIDLRNNPGGHLNMAVTLSGYFLKKGDVVVSAKGRKKENDAVFTASGETGIVPRDLPVVVLINGGSASASEIMAGALQDHKRAKLLGVKSFGKGSVQQVFRPLADDTAALITIQKYFTPNNRSIHGIGLTPDIVVDELKPTEDERFYLYKMSKEKWIDSFVKTHAEYSDRLNDLFLEEAAKRGWHFRREFIRVVLKTEYYRHSSKLPDPEIDPQLARALQEIAAK